MRNTNTITEEIKTKYSLTDEMISDYYFKTGFENYPEDKWGGTLEDAIEEGINEYNENGAGKLEARTQANRGFQLEQQRKMFSNR